ncbi:MAG: flagellar basal body P-ring formation protein FlgA [Acidobacteria bacterium]|nr:flagellar basal body P-ring formation protein FlgA [Acidobacteriota bacterium]
MFARAFLIALLTGSTPLVARGDVAVDVRVQQAIEDAVAERVGHDAIVTARVTDIRAGELAEGVVAWPEQDTRAGVPARFALYSSRSRRVRIGEATAVVSVTVEAIRLRRPVLRGESIEMRDIEEVRHELDGPLAPVAGIDDVLGARARRDVSADTILSRSDVVPEPAIKSGESVRAVVRIGGVEVSATAIALQSGARNEVIRLTNPGSRKTLLGRVVRRGEVEVIDAR